MQVTLADSEIISLEGGRRGLAIRCTTGLLWVTTGDGCDYLIKPGQAFALAAHRTALVEACEPAIMHLDRTETGRFALVMHPVPL